MSGIEDRLAKIKQMAAEAGEKKHAEEERAKAEAAEARGAKEAEHTQVEGQLAESEERIDAAEAGIVEAEAFLSADLDPETTAAIQGEIEGMRAEADEIRAERAALQERFGALSAELGVGAEEAPEKAVEEAEEKAEEAPSETEAIGEAEVIEETSEQLPSDVVEKAEGMAEETLSADLKEKEKADVEEGKDAETIEQSVEITNSGMKQVEDLQQELESGIEGKSYDDLLDICSKLGGYQPEGNLSRPVGVDHRDTTPLSAKYEEWGQIGKDEIAKLAAVAGRENVWEFFGEMGDYAKKVEKGESIDDVPQEVKSAQEVWMGYVQPSEGAPEDVRVAYEQLQKIKKSNRMEQELGKRAEKMLEEKRREYFGKATEDLTDEEAEQLSREIPDHVLVDMFNASVYGGKKMTLLEHPTMKKRYEELQKEALDLAEKILDPNKLNELIKQEYRQPSLQLSEQAHAELEQGKRKNSFDTSFFGQRDLSNDFLKQFQMMFKVITQRETDKFASGVANRDIRSPQVNTEALQRMIDRSSLRSKVKVWDLKK